jgi:choline dehydrogenase-like flavoprotein
MTACEKILSDLQQVYPNLSPQLRRAAHFLIDRPDEIAFTSMRQLADRAGVQPATMVRLAQAIGFEGYEALREPFRDIMAESRHVSPCYAYREKLEGESGEPGADVVTDDDMIEYLRNFWNTGFHPTSTCRMGVDETAVVDPRLRLHGFEGLRVVDASVMPSITSGNTNAPTIMIAEKVADMIREVARIS